MHKFDAYQKFVESTTSDMSKNTLGLASRILKLEGNTSTTHNSDGSVSRTADINMATLLTSVIGMMAEAGEFAEVVKKKECNWAGWIIFVIVLAVVIIVSANNNN